MKSTTVDDIPSFEDNEEAFFAYCRADAEYVTESEIPYEDTWAAKTDWTASGQCSEYLEDNE